MIILCSCIVTLYRLRIVSTKEADTSVLASWGSRGPGSRGLRVSGFTSISCTSYGRFLRSRFIQAKFSRIHFCRRFLAQKYCSGFTHTSKECSYLRSFIHQIHQILSLLGHRIVFRPRGYSLKLLAYK